MIDNDKLGTMPVKKLLFELSVPAIFAQIVNVLYNLIDRLDITFGINCFTNKEKETGR